MCSKQWWESPDDLAAWNLGAALIMTALFIAAVTVFAIRYNESFRAEITTTFRVYNANATGPVQAGPLSNEVRSLGYYRLAGVQITFPLVTAISHYVQWARARDPSSSYVHDVVERGRNPARWIEYGISASMMTWVIAQLDGVTDVCLLVLLAPVGNVVLQAMGYLMERMNPHVHKRNAPVRWAPTLIGWVLFAGQWAVLTAFFFAQVNSDRPDGAAVVPPLVKAIHFVLLGLYALFGALQLFHYLKWFKLGHPVVAEKGYIVLSMTAKVSLELMLTIGIAVNALSNA